MIINTLYYRNSRNVSDIQVAELSSVVSKKTNLEAFCLELNRFKFLANMLIGY